MAQSVPQTEEDGQPAHRHADTQPSNDVSLNLFILLRFRPETACTQERGGAKQNAATEPNETELLKLLLWSVFTFEP